MSVRVTALFCAALALNCGEALSSGDVVGTYALRQVAGDPLPAVLYTNESVIVRVFADTLRFTSDSRGTSTTVRETEPVTGGSPTGPMRGEVSFGFQVAEGTIQIAFDCPINANCVAPPHLVLKRTGDGLRADFALGARTPLVYARLAPSF